MAVAKKRTTKKTSTAKKAPPPEHKKCTQCQRNLFANEFYQSKSPLYADGTMPICKECFISNCFDPKTNYIDTKAFKDICKRMDIVFLESVWDAVVDKHEELYMKKEGPLPPTYKKGAIGKYMRQINTLDQYSTLRWEDSSFNSVVTMEKENLLVPYNQWGEKDLKSKEHCLNVLGYDPFEDEEGTFTTTDKKYGYNVLASYLNEVVLEDASKVEGALGVTRTLMQLKKVDSKINKILNAPANSDSQLSNLSGLKNKLMQDLDRQIKSFGLREAALAVGSRTLSQNIKDMKDNGHPKGYFNLFEVKVSDVMKQVAEASAHGIFEQLAFNSNDYADMIKEQHLLIKKLNDEIALLEEENRSLYNKVQYLEGDK